MLLSSETKDSLMSIEFNSFNEGFEYYDGITNECLIEFSLLLNKINDINLSILSDLTEDYKVSYGVQNKLIDLKNTTNKSFETLARWSAKFIAWVKSFVMQSSAWVKKHEKRIKQASFKIEGKDFKYAEIDIDFAKSIVKSTSSSFDKLQYLFSKYSNVNSLKKLELGEPMSLKSITDFSSTKEIFSNGVKKGLRPVNIDSMISEVYSIESELKQIVGLKNNMNSLKGKVDSFISSIGKEESSEVFKNAYELNNYLRVSLSSALQAITSAIKILNTGLKQNLKIFRTVMY